MAAPYDTVVDSVLSDFTRLTKRPEAYLAAQPQVTADFKAATKKVYDFIKDSEHSSDEALPELIIDNFDDEQIWQELELQNEGVIRSLLNTVPHIVTCKTVGFGLSSTVSEDNILKDSEMTFTKLKSKKLSKSKNAESCIDEADTSFSEIEKEDQVGLDESESDEEITKIKSRLKSSLDDEEDINVSDDGDSDDLDFHFGGLGEDGVEKKMSDDSEDGKDPTDRITYDDSSEPKSTISDKSTKKAQRTSVVDDKFFKLSRMEEFLEQEEKRESKLIEKEKDGEDEDVESDDSGESVDIFGDLATDEDSEDEQDKATRDMKYSDYFRDSDADDQKMTVDGKTPRKRKKVHFSAMEEELSDERESAENPPEVDQSEESSEGEDMAEIFGGRRKSEDQSNFEKRQERLKKKISEMEEASLADKPWQLAGEVSSARRPENSLLEEFLQFDQTTKLPPVITEETTQTIEELIRQRIKDQAWDDVERKVKPKEDPFEYKKRIVLDQEKSKKSLGEIYEEEYLKQQKKEEEEQKVPDHEHIKKEMRDLFIKLDALCNFHFTPKQAAPDIKIISNLPSVSMEEVAPVSASDASMLAPQEIQDKEKGETKGKTEKTLTDRKRERREKKAAKRARQKAREQREKLVTKLHPGLGNKYSKEKALKELEKSSKQDSAIRIIKEDRKGKKASTSSKTFFSKLQEEVTSQISKRKLEKSRDHNKSGKSSKKLKL